MLLTLLTDNAISRVAFATENMRICIVSDVGKLDPRVMDYAATKLQAGFRGWQTRQRMKNGNI